MAAKTVNGKRGSGAKKTDASDTWFGRVISPQLRQARLRKEWTHDELSARMGGFIHPRMLSSYESGTEPKYTTFLVLCVTLGLDPLKILPISIRRLIDNGSATELAAALNDS